MNNIVRIDTLPPHACDHGFVAAQWKRLGESGGVFGGKCLDGAGGTLQDIVRLGLFITDTKLYAKVSEVRARYFLEPYPVSTCVGIAGFVQEEALIEIDAIAMLGRGA